MAHWVGGICHCHVGPCPNDPNLCPYHRLYDLARHPQNDTFGDGIHDRTARSYGGERIPRSMEAHIRLGPIKLPGTTPSLQFAALLAYGSCSLLVP